MVASVNETLSYNQWLQRYCFLSQLDASLEVYCLFHVAKFSRAFHFSWLVQEVVGSVSAGKGRNQRCTRSLRRKKQPCKCRERGWSPTPQKVANLLVRFINQHMNEITVLRYSSCRLQPTRLQPSELHMWHSVAGQVAQENPQHRDCSYVQWARGYARKTIGKTHAWRLQLRWVVLTL